MQDKLTEGVDYKKDWYHLDAFRNKEGRVIQLGRAYNECTTVNPHKDG